MWTLPREDMTLKKICPYLTQTEEIVMGSLTLAWLFLQRATWSLYFIKKRKEMA